MAVSARSESEPAMRVVVTGASGYLGGRLCRQLLKQGHSVRALDLVRPTSDDMPAPSLELVYGDVTDYQSLIPAFSDCDVVFHVAAVVESWLPDPSKFFSVNVEGLNNVLRAVGDTKTVKKLIYTSSYFALGPTAKGHVADETQFHHERFFCTEYERSKEAADKIALQAAKDGQPIVLLYPGLMYGPGKLTPSNAVARTIVERFNGRLPGYVGSGSDKCSFSHVDDVVDGHIRAMSNGRIGERYLLSGENASFKDMFDECALITRTGRPRFHIPLWLIEAYGWLSILVIWRITGKPPLITPPAVEVMRHQWAYSCEKAKQELGYNPRSLRTGLEEVLPWLKNLALNRY